MVLIVVVIVSTTIAARVRARSVAEAQRAAGSALFHGQAPLPGRLPGQGMTLPTIATRCSNCHEASPRESGGIGATAGSTTTARSTVTAAARAGAAPADSSATSDGYATRLRGDWLAQPRSRRGGPPSTYDAGALCTLLRAGTDPAHVVVPTVMPRYSPSDADCGALWAYLASR